MKYNEEENEFTLSNGKSFYANCGILGMSEEGIREGRFFEGYDGTNFNKDFTVKERREIADYIIGLWNKWAESK